MTHTHTHTHPCFPPSVTPIIPISHACTLSHVAYLSHFPMSHRVSPQCISYRTMYLTAMYILPQCILPQCISYRNVNLTVSGNPHPFPHLGTQALFRLRLRLALLLRTRPTAAASEVTHLCHVSHSPIYIYIYIYMPHSHSSPLNLTGHSFICLYLCHLQLWRGRCRKGKVSVNSRHEDFPALLSEALDRIWAYRDVKLAADALGVSSSQLVKLLKQEPPALEWVNRMRASQGLRPLRVSS